MKLLQALRLTEASSHLFDIERAVTSLLEVSHLSVQFLRNNDHAHSIGGFVF